MMEDIVLLETELVNPKKEVFVLQFQVGEFDMVVFDPPAASCSIFEIKHSKEIVPGQHHHLLHNLGKTISRTMRQNRTGAALRDKERFESSSAAPITQTAVSCRRAMFRLRLEKPEECFPDTLLNAIPTGKTHKRLPTVLCKTQKIQTCMFVT